MLSEDTRAELNRRAKRLSEKIATDRINQDTTAKTLAGITATIEADQEERDLLTNRLDQDMAERRAARDLELTNIEQDGS